MSIKGAMIAASVAGLFTMGVAGMASAKSAKKGDDVMCNGVNACKGRGLQGRRQRLQGKERMQGAGEHEVEQGRLRRQGRKGRQVARRRPAARRGAAGRTPRETS